MLFVIDFVEFGSCCVGSVKQMNREAVKKSPVSGSELVFFFQTINMELDTTELTEKKTM